MGTFFIVPFGDELDLARHPSFHTLSDAQRHAEWSRSRNGKHYHVLKVEWAWTTQTLADLKAEGAIK